MPDICMEGVPKVFALVHKGYKIEQICDRFGRSVHPDAEEFLSYHRQAKRMMIVNWIGRYYTVS